MNNYQKGWADGKKFVLSTRVEDLEDGLKRLEWSCFDPDGFGDVCPVCYCHKELGVHAPLCWLNDLLEGTVYQCS